MHSTDKLHKKYLNQKRFLINAVLHEIFKSNRNTIEKLLWTITTLIRAKMIWNEHGKKIIQKTNVNKRFATFPTMIKHEKHIDNRAKTSENSDEFLRSLAKSLKIKFLYPLKRSMRMLSFKMRNLRGLKNDIFYQQSRGFFLSPAFRSSRRRCFIKKLLIIVSKSSQRQTCIRVFFVIKLQA